MNSLEFGKTAAALLFAAAEALAPKGMIAQTREVTPVNPLLMKAAIDCALTEKPGKTILATNEYPEGQREIVIFTTHYTHTVDITKNYPRPSSWQVSAELTVPVQPYIAVTEKRNTESEQELPRLYIDGNMYPITQEIVDSEENPTEKAKIKALMEIDAGKRLDGVVDNAMYPEDRDMIQQIIESSGGENATSRLRLEERFRKKLSIYQEGFRSAIKRIVEACRRNR